MLHRPSRMDDWSQPGPGFDLHCWFEPRSDGVDLGLVRRRTHPVELDEKLSLQSTHCIVFGFFAFSE